MQFDNYDPALGQFSAVFSLGTVKFGVQYMGKELSNYEFVCSWSIIILAVEWGKSR